MEKIASFTVNHLDLLTGIYVSRKDYIGKGACDGDGGDTCAGTSVCYIFEKS